MPHSHINAVAGTGNSRIIGAVGEDQILIQGKFLRVADLSCRLNLPGIKIWVEKHKIKAILTNFEEILGFRIVARLQK